MERCINFAPRVYRFLASYMPHANIPICIRNEALVNDNPQTPQPEDRPEPDCDAAENQAPPGFRRWTFRVVPGVEGTFFRPKTETGCVLCALSFKGPRARTNVHPWVGQLNTMVDALWGVILVDQHIEQGSTRYLHSGDSLSTYRAEHKPVQYISYGSTNMDQAYKSALESNINTLRLNSVGVNGQGQQFIPFLHVETQIVPGVNTNRGVGVLSAFDGINYSFRDSVDAAYRPWRTFGNLMFDFGSIHSAGLTSSTSQAFGWQLQPVIGDSMDITSVTLYSTLAGDLREETFSCTEAADEILQFMDSSFTQRIGYFEQDSRRRLVFVDRKTQQKHPIDNVRFHETYTRDNIMAPNAPVCSANLMCPVIPQCAICLKWDTLTVEDFEDVDQYTPPPCEQQKLEQLKAEITARYMEEIRKLRESIAAAYVAQCLSTTSVIDRVKATYDLKTYHYTLYYYDRAGRLVRTVSPKGVDINPNRTISSTPAHTFVSRFMTDSKGRMLIKTVPDGGSERYEYDKFGRLRFIVDAVQNAAANKRMTYFRYDALGRIKETGEVVLSDEQSLEEAIYYKRNDDEWPNYTEHTRNDVVVYVYDHPMNSTAGGSGESGWTHVKSKSGLEQRNLRLRLSWAYTVPAWEKDATFANLSNVVRTFFSYDAQGNVTTVVHDIPYSDEATPNGTDRLIKRVDYRYDHSTGAPLAVDYQVHSVDDDADRFQHRYEYDPNGRMKIVETSRNGVMWDRDVVYDYNLNGSLRRETIGEDSVQGRDYTYTLLGQIKGINHPSLDPASDPGADGTGTGIHSSVGKDAFRMGFSYHTGDFEREFNATASPFNHDDPAMLGAPVDLYSGLMSALSYRTMETGSVSIHRDGELLGEEFVHDRMGRMRSSTTAMYDAGWVSDGDGGWTSKYQMDPNSNIVRIERWGYETTSSNVKFDDAVLNLNSGSSGNTIASVDDIGTPINSSMGELHSAPNGTISSDLIGSMTATEMGVDLNFVFTSRHELESYSSNSVNVRLLRNPFKQLVRSSVFNGTSLASTEFILPGSLATDAAVYRKGPQFPPSIIEWGIVGTNAIGVSRDVDDQQATNEFVRDVGKKMYQLVDNVGSVRVLVFDIKDKENSEYVCQIAALSDYEGYGIKKSLRSSIDHESVEYRYGFQGMRNLVELGNQSLSITPFRLYDARFGRWTSTDPVLNAPISGYEAFGSSPAHLTDNSGLAPTRRQMHSMNEALYSGDYSKVEGGWVPSTEYFVDLTWDEAGFQSMLFERDNPVSGNREYSYVFRGSQECQDWIEDFIRQPFGIEGQYTVAIENALDLDDMFSNSGNELTFGGHSLGGGMGIAASIATGRLAIVENPAGLSLATLSYINSQADGGIHLPANVDVLRVEGEVVGEFQKGVNALIMFGQLPPFLWVYTFGMVTELPATYLPEIGPFIGLNLFKMIDNHMTPAVAAKLPLVPFSSPVLVTAPRTETGSQPQGGTNQESPPSTETIHKP